MFPSNVIDETIYTDKWRVNQTSLISKYQVYNNSHVAIILWALSYRNDITFRVHWPTSSSFYLTLFLRTRLVSLLSRSYYPMNLFRWRSRLHRPVALEGCWSYPEQILEIVAQTFLLARRHVFIESPMIQPLLRFLVFAAHTNHLFLYWFRSTLRDDKCPRKNNYGHLRELTDTN